MTSKAFRNRALRLEPLERRLCMSLSVGWDGPGQGSASLTYYIENVPAHGFRSVRQSIARARRISSSAPR